MIKQGCTVQDNGRSKFACNVEWTDCGSCGESHLVDMPMGIDCRQDCYRGPEDYCRTCKHFHPLRPVHLSVPTGETSCKDGSGPRTSDINFATCPDCLRIHNLYMEVTGRKEARP